MAEKNIEAHVVPNGQPISSSRRGSVSKSAEPFQTEIEDVANVEVTDEQNRKVLRKIDTLCVLLGHPLLHRPPLTEAQLITYNGILLYASISRQRCSGRLDIAWYP
jgi:hypothetical protein